jgi:LysR family glycine cleavage system transcriptional activator
MSFTRAAEELNVTQAAISHQVKALEERIGLTLFRRQNRNLFLTDAGQAYFPGVRDALDALAQATDRLKTFDTGGVLTVSALPSFAARWLVPRLGRFRQRHPEFDIRLDASPGLTDFGRADVDVAIRLGAGRYPGLHTVRLMRENVFPVCSPELLKGPHALRQPEDLRHHTLLHDEDYAQWRIWLAAHKVEGVEASRGPMFIDSSMLMEAAARGQGVALGRSALAADDLATGRLVRPFDVSLPHQYSYYVVCPEAHADRPKIKAFRDWLLAEVAAENPDDVIVADPPEGWLDIRPHASMPSPPAANRAIAEARRRRGDD